MKSLTYLCLLVISLGMTLGPVSADACSYTSSRVGYVGFASGDYVYSKNGQLIGMAISNYLYNNKWQPVAYFQDTIVTGLYDHRLSGMITPGHFQSYSGEIIIASGCTKTQIALGSLFVPLVSSNQPNRIGPRPGAALP